jgi:hypothetical protein
MRFQLVAEIVDEDLFRKAIHEAGTIFYRKLENGEYELVYFSGSRIVRFHGKLSKEFGDYVEAVGFGVTEIEIDPANFIIKIKQ